MFLSFVFVPWNWLESKIKHVATSYIIILGIPGVLAHLAQPSIGLNQVTPACKTPLGTHFNRYGYVHCKALIISNEACTHVENASGKIIINK